MSRRRFSTVLVSTARDFSSSISATAGEAELGRTTVSATAVSAFFLGSIWIIAPAMYCGVDSTA